MAGILLMLSYVSIAVFLAAVIYRAVKLSRLPMHLRWELYPVAHEKGRASYGGSYLEESDWWTKPRQSSLAGEMKVMLPEILLLAGVSVLPVPLRLVPLGGPGRPAAGWRYRYGSRSERVGRRRYGG